MELHEKPQYMYRYSTISIYPLSIEANQNLKTYFIESILISHYIGVFFTNAKRECQMHRIFSEMAYPIPEIIIVFDSQTVDKCSKLITGQSFKN